MEIKKATYLNQVFYFCEGKRGPLFFKDKLGKSRLSFNELKKFKKTPQELYNLLERKFVQKEETLSLFESYIAWLQILSWDKDLFMRVKKEYEAKKKNVLAKRRGGLFLFSLLTKRPKEPKVQEFEITTDIQHPEWPLNLLFRRYKNKFIANLPEILMIEFTHSIKKTFPKKIFEFKKI